MHQRNILLNAHKKLIILLVQQFIKIVFNFICKMCWFVFIFL